MRSQIAVRLLAEVPDKTETLVALYESEWSDWYGPAGPGNARADLRESLNTDRLPVVFVAVDDQGCAVGSAALKQHSLPSHPYLSPWLSAFVVDPSQRGRGIGSTLAEAVAERARMLDFSRIYCGTTSAYGMLTRLGWIDMHDRAPAEFGNVAILSKIL